MKKDFYFVGGVILFIIIAFLWQSYRQSSIEPYIFSSSASVRSDNICREIPNENDYKISQIFDGEIANVDLGDNREILAVENEILKSIKKEGINFAGKYSVATTTCGHLCDKYLIVNMEIGGISSFSLKSDIGAKFSSTSSLFIINPPDRASFQQSLQTASRRRPLSNLTEGSSTSILTSYYKMNDDKIELICKSPIY